MDQGWTILGTYRTFSQSVLDLKQKGATLFHCDLLDEESIQKACKQLTKKWDVLIFCPGSTEPIGQFLQCSFKEWSSSIDLNFSNQLSIAHKLLPFRNLNAQIEPCVLFFAGGGTNNATQNYSAYTISKIALIKMTELLDAEIQDTRFSIVGPGWVKTKIHQETLVAGEELAGENYNRTQSNLNSEKFTPMDDVLDCCEWIIDSPRNVISGRNFSVVYDQWGQEELSQSLLNDSHMYKLRRSSTQNLLKLNLQKI